MTINLDETDLAILASLQEDSSLANSELAKRVGMAPSAVLERVKKLEAKGVITGYPASLDPAALDLKLLAFMFIRSSEGPGNLAIAKQLARLPEVLELHHIAGEDCYIAKVRTKDPQALAQLIREKFGKIKGLVSTKTTIVLETLKEQSRLPIPKNLNHV